MVQLINCLYSRDCKKTIGGVKDKIMSLFKTNTTKDYSKPTRFKNAYRGRKKPRKQKIKKQEDRIIKNIRNLFKLKK